MAPAWSRFQSHDFQGGPLCSSGSLQNARETSPVTFRDIILFSLGRSGVLLSSKSLVGCIIFDDRNFRIASFKEESTGACRMLFLSYPVPLPSLLPFPPHWASFPRAWSRPWRLLRVVGGNLGWGVSTKATSLKVSFARGRDTSGFGFSIQLKNNWWWTCQLQRLWARQGRERCKDKENVFCALKGITGVGRQTWMNTFNVTGSCALGFASNLFMSLDLLVGSVVCVCLEEGYYYFILFMRKLGLGEVPESRSHGFEQEIWTRHHKITLLPSDDT